MISFFFQKKKKRRREVTIRRFILEPSFVNYEYFNRKLTQRLLQRKNSFQKKKRRKKEAINSVCLIVFHKLCHSFYKEISVRVWEHARLIGFIAKNSAVEFDRDRRSIRSVSNRSNSSGGGSCLRIVRKFTRSLALLDLSSR